MFSILQVKVYVYRNLFWIVSYLKCILEGKQDGKQLMANMWTSSINLATICSLAFTCVRTAQSRERERERERESLKVLHRIVISKLPRYDDIAGEFTSGRTLQFRLGRRSLTRATRASALTAAYRRKPVGRDRCIVNGGSQWVTIAEATPRISHRKMFHRASIVIRRRCRESNCPAFVSETRVIPYYVISAS